MKHIPTHTQKKKLYESYSNFTFNTQNLKTILLVIKRITDTQSILYSFGGLLFFNTVKLTIEIPTSYFCLTDIMLGEGRQTHKNCCI